MDNSTILSSGVGFFNIDLHVLVFMFTTPFPVSAIFAGGKNEKLLV